MLQWTPWSMHGQSRNVWLWVQLFKEMNDYSCTCNCGCQNSSGEYLCRSCKIGICASNSAYLLIICNEGKLGDVLSKIKILTDVKEVQETCGAYDIIAKIESITSNRLQKFLIKRIQNLTNVRSAMALHCKPSFAS